MGWFVNSFPLFPLTPHAEHAIYYATDTSINLYQDGHSYVVFPNVTQVRSLDYSSLDKMLYWVEFSHGEGRIRRGSVNGSTPIEDVSYGRVNWGERVRGLLDVLMYVYLHDGLNLHVTCIVFMQALTFGHRIYTVAKSSFKAVRGWEGESVSMLRHKVKKVVLG